MAWPTVCAASGSASRRSGWSSWGRSDLGHLAADEVFARVEPLLPGVNRSTVYRTLELFRDLGLVSMTDLGGGARQFELIDDLHHHLICHRCGAILELDDALVDPLRDGIRDRYGLPRPSITWRSSVSAPSAPADG